MKLDKLADELFELSRYCAEEDEAALMDAARILKEMAEEIKNVCN
jgi:hypothetical protein